MLLYELVSHKSRVYRCRNRQELQPFDCGQQDTFVQQTSRPDTHLAASRSSSFLYSPRRKKKQDQRKDKVILPVLLFLVMVEQLDTRDNAIKRLLTKHFTALTCLCFTKINHNQLGVMIVLQHYCNYAEIFLASCLQNAVHLDNYTQTTGCVKVGDKQLKGTDQ